MSQNFHTSQLAAIAYEIDQAIDEKVYRVDAAMDIDDDFVNPQARALLVRDVVIAAAATAASRIGSIEYQAVNGLGRELRATVGNADRRYRIKRAARVGDLLEIRANSDSALVRTEEPEDALLFGVIEQWVFGWHLNSEDAVDEVFIAKVLPTTPGSTYLNLSNRRTLLSVSAGPEEAGRFERGPDEGLPGFEDGEGDLGVGWH
jgi:hypothetical protein